MRWSVVITTRNRAPMLRRAIQSCSGQTVPCEVVVVDEASTDDTPNIAIEFPGIRYIRNAAPLGHSGAANLGIREASGDWIKPLDDDDWLAPDCLEQMTRALERAQGKGFSPVIITGNVITVDEQEHELLRSQPIIEQPAVLPSHTLLRLMMIEQAPMGTPVQVGHQRQAALDAGGWNEKRPFTHLLGDEVEMWIRLASRGDAVFIPAYIAYRTYWTGGNTRWMQPEVCYESNVYLKDEIAGHLGEKTPQSIRSFLALHWGLIAVRDKHYSQAVRLGLKWVRDPFSVRHMLNRRGYKDARKRLQAV